MKRSSVKPGNRITVGKPKSSPEPMRDDDNLMSGNGASSSRSNGSPVQVNGYRCIAPDVKVGHNVKFSQFINLYGCEVGDDTKIGAFVEIQKNAKVGKRCKISSHTFICEGVTIEDEVLIGHNVTFVNDSFPRATSATGALQTEADWKVEVTLVKRGASIGSGATILSNVVIGENALIGAGCVVTRDVPANAIVVGNPGKVLRYIKSGDNHE
jgi:UDP-2-acetamido-3-amino-2,3-dideoxy-glucuronate N-acetyltransferase